MTSFSDVIDAIGIAQLAEIIGKPDSHVRTLKARESIPPGFFKPIVESSVGRAAGITFELLHSLLEQARRGEPAAAVKRATASEPAEATA